MRKRLTAVLQFPREAFHVIMNIIGCSLDCVLLLDWFQHAPPAP